MVRPDMTSFHRREETHLSGQTGTVRNRNAATFKRHTWPVHPSLVGARKQSRWRRLEEKGGKNQGGAGVGWWGGVRVRKQTPREKLFFNWRNSAGRFSSLQLHMASWQPEPCPDKQAKVQRESLWGPGSAAFSHLVSTSSATCLEWWASKGGVEGGGAKRRKGKRLSSLNTSQRLNVTVRRNVWHDRGKLQACFVLFSSSSFFFC